MRQLGGLDSGMNKIITVTFYHQEISFGIFPQNFDGFLCQFCYGWLFALYNAVYFKLHMAWFKQT